MLHSQGRKRRTERITLKTYGAGSENNRETGREGKHRDDFTKTNRVNTAERER